MIELAAVMSNGKNIIADDISYNSLSENHVIMAKEKTLKEYTIDIIKYYLEKYDNNVLKVAEKIDIGKSTIYKMTQDKEVIVN